MRAASKRILTRRREQIILAHAIGSLVGFAKPQPLEKLLKALEPQKPRPPMSEAEVQHTMALWAVAASASNREQRRV
jgi:hypothetical protein